MLKKIIATSLVATALIFSGCGDEDGEDFLKAQHSIDVGDTSTAIALLEATPAEQRTDAQNVQLGSAYMSEAGYSVLDVVGTMASGVDDTSGDDALETFKNLMLPDDINKTATLESIDAAIDSYKLVVGDSNASSVDDLGDNELSLGLAYMVKVSILLDNNTSTPEANEDLANTLTDAFYFVAAVGNDDMAADIETMKAEAFFDGDTVAAETGDIDASVIANYLGQ